MRNNDTRQGLCHECGQQAIVTVDGQKISLLIRAWVVCPDCIAKIPEDLFEKVIEAIHGKEKKNGQ